VAPVKKHVTIRLKFTPPHSKLSTIVLLSCTRSLSAVRLPVEERLLLGIYLPIASKVSAPSRPVGEVGEAVFVTLFMLGRNVFLRRSLQHFAELQFSLLTHNRINAGCLSGHPWCLAIRMPAGTLTRPCFAGVCAVITAVIFIGS
jgi:hypothetical protein